MVEHIESIKDSIILIFEDLGLLFFTALVFTLLLTPASISLAEKIGAMDTPNDRSVHVRIMPRMGGLGMAISVVVSLFLFVEMNHVIVAFLAGTLIVITVGMLDDLFQIRPLYKMAGQILACSVFLYVSELQITSLGNLLGMGVFDFYQPWSFLLTLFCMLGVINAFNLSDGLDGLAAGLTLIASLFMAALALLSGNWEALFVIVAVIGATFAFLKFNSFPAKLFMGDTGSLSLGFFMACLIVFLVAPEHGNMIEPITLALILGLPITDTLLVMTRRILRGKSPASADKTHFHHRLLGLGFSHALVVIIIYVLAAGLGVLALGLYTQPAWVQLVLGLLYCFSFYGLLMEFERRSIDFSKIHFLQQAPLTITHQVGKSLKGLRYVILIGLLAPLFFVHSSPAEVHNVLLGVFVLLLLAYPWREHTERLNIVYGLFYLSGLTILYVWNISTYDGFSLSWYTLAFVIILSGWSVLKIVFKGHREVFLTSGLEVILIFVSWFVPYALLPVLNVSAEVLVAVKMSCLQAIPLFIAMKIVIRRHPDRNYMFISGIIGILLLMLVLL